ncbi:MAG: TVP38/TMEM64 family protein [Clostridiales bacterium]|nr:TVP38/TMEM64 family protein [Clostridiales bacterium]
MGIANKIFSLLKKFIYILLIMLCGVTGIVFSFLYIEAFGIGNYGSNGYLSKAVVLTAITVLAISSIIFYGDTHKFICKLCYLSVFLVSIFSCTLYLLKIFGVLDKFDSVEKFRIFISSYDNLAVVIFIAVQFLQVVVLPIPSVITVGAGVLMFGPLRGGFLSCVGIISGSIVAYFIGKIFGYKVVKWLVGEDALKKGLNLIKGKDKIILIFALLFPFFPDDLLCFVAGITTVSPLFFITTVFITRAISIFASTFSLNNSLIPFTTWWGILLWITFFILTFLIFLYLMKNGDQIEGKILKKNKLNKS